MRSSVEFACVWAVLASLSTVTTARGQEAFSGFTGDVSAKVSLSHTAMEPKVGDPIYPVNGEVKIDLVDFSVPSVGFPFAFDRHYKSMVAYNGPLGHRWDFSFNARFETNIDNGVTRILSYDGTGRVDLYTPRSGSSPVVYDGPTGRYDTFAYDSSVSRWVRTSKDGFRFEYDVYTSGAVTKGRVRYLRDLNGNATEVVFPSASPVSSNPDTKIEKVKDTQGREYPFTYDSNNRLQFIEDYGSPARKIKFEYDSYGDLTKVTALHGETGAKVTTYTYNSSTASDPYRHLLLTITDPKENAQSTPKPFVRNYYTANTMQCFAQEYGPGADSLDSGTPSPAFTLSQGSSPGPKTTTVVDRAGTGIKYYFDVNNLLTKKEWLHGTNPAWTYSYDTKFNLIGLTKPNGAREEYTYDTNANLLTQKSTDASGANALTTSYEYDISRYHVLTKSTDAAGVVDTFAYDTRANLLTHVHDAGSGRLNLTTSCTYLSGSRYLLDTVTDPRGKVIDFNYDGDYRPYTVQADTGGLAIQTGAYLYDQFGNVTTAKDALAHETTFEVDRANRVTKRIAPTPLSYEEKYYFDLTDNLTKVETQNAASDWFTVDLEYDLLDRLTKRIEDVQGATRRTTEYAYDQEDRITSVTTPTGDVFTAEYDAFGLRTKAIDAAGTGYAASRTFEYDTNFRLTKAIEPKSSSHYTKFYYDHHDRMTKTENALGHYAVTEYGPDHLPDAVAAYRSGGVELSRSTFAYDSANRQTKSEAKIYTSGGSAVGDGWITSEYVFDPAGNVLTTKDENNNLTICTYDGLGRISVCQDAIGSKVTFTYDALGNILTKKEEEKQGGVSGFDTYLWRFEYDNLNRVTKAYDPANFASLYTFDHRSNLVTTENPNGWKSFFAYDELGRGITARVQYSGTNELTTRTEFDHNDRVTKVWDAKNYATTYAYDRLSRCTTQTFADSGVRAFTYDVNSNVLTTTDQNGTQVFGAYDLLNRLTNRTFALATHVRGEDTAQTYAYDGLGRLTSAGDTDSLVLYTYNTASLVETETMRYGVGNTGSGGKVVTWSYDDQGRVSTLLYPGATATDGKLTYAYDELNRMTKVDRQLTSTTTKTLGTWDYKGGRLLKRTNGNGTWVDVSYDSRKLPTSVAHKRTDSSTTESILTAEYAYDSAGHVTTEGLKHYLNNGSLHQDKGFTFLYDKAYRLTKSYREVPASELGQDPPTNYATKLVYTLDANGNRVTVATTPKSGSTTNDVYTANSTNAYSNVTWNGTSEGFGYDLTGDRTSAAGARSWQFDFDHHLVALQIDEAEHSAYLYDALGRRIEKQFQYDGLEYEYRKRFFFAGGSLIQEYDVIDDSPGEAVRLEIEYFWGAAGAEPVYIRKYDPDLSTLEQEGYYHQNAQGSVYALTGVDAAANIVETYRYSEFGELQHIYATDTTTDLSASFGNKWFHRCNYYDHEVTYVASGQALYGGPSNKAFDPEQNAPISRVGGDADAGGNPDPAGASHRNDPDWFGSDQITQWIPPTGITDSRRGGSDEEWICSPPPPPEMPCAGCPMSAPNGVEQDTKSERKSLATSAIQSPGGMDPISFAITGGVTHYVGIAGRGEPFVLPPHGPLNNPTEPESSGGRSWWRRVFFGEAAQLIIMAVGFIPGVGDAVEIGYMTLQLLAGEITGVQYAIGVGCSAVGSGLMLMKGTVAAAGAIVGGVAALQAGKKAASEVVEEVAENVAKEAGDCVVKQGGRHGSKATRDHVDQVAGELEADGWTVTNRGGKEGFKEEYLPPLDGGRKGGSYPDITATKDGKTLRVNTVDTKADGVTPTGREARNADRIRSQRPNDELILIPKPKPRPRG